ncbi:AraC family transcriptional regulator [Tenacibaculum sp. 190524A02b]|uniref:AraC family transcriptional regulator n=1 Tax=Tenacibaculum vairaonense TaxID=3137860 RepID=A0ABM9PI13_9FLAO
MKISNDIIGRINKALLFIDENLQTKLLLDNVAKEACYSPYHFHRLFTAVVGETFTNYIQRKRIERAAIFLLKNKPVTISEIAEVVGFTNVSSFSRSFKKYYGVSPKELKESTEDKFSKICITESKKGQITITLEKYISNIDNHLNFITMNASVKIETINAIEVAYISHIGNPEKLGDTFDKLIKWAYPKGLMTDTTKMATIYHDSPKITTLDKMRMSACIVLEKALKTDGEVGLRTIPAGKYAIASYEITIDKFEKAWEAVFVWLSQKGFKVRVAEPFEIYHNDFNMHPEKKCIVDFYVPVENS